MKLLSDSIHHPGDPLKCRLRHSLKLLVFPALGLVSQAGEAQVSTEVGLHLNLLSRDSALGRQELLTPDENLLSLFEFKQVLQYFEMALSLSKLVNLNRVETEVHFVEESLEEQRRLISVILYYLDEGLHKFLVQ